MTRAVLHVLACLSLVASIAMIVLWVRSYGRSEFVSRRSSELRGTESVEHTYSVTWTLGTMRFVVSRNAFFVRDTAPAFEGGSATWALGQLGLRQSDKLPGDSILNRLGFHTFQSDWKSPFGTSMSTRLTIPAWLLPLALAIPPIMRIWGAIRRRRAIAIGCCRQCGYDLRATPERCPECGTPAAIAKTAVGSS